LFSERGKGKRFPTSIGLPIINNSFIIMAATPPPSSSSFPQSQPAARNPFASGATTPGGGGLGFDKSRISITDSFPCFDFVVFKSSLNDLRKFDDNLNFFLNRTGPTVRDEDRVSCSQILRHLTELHSFRNERILTCLKENNEHLEQQTTTSYSSSPSSSSSSPSSSSSTKRGNEADIAFTRRRISNLRAEQDVEQILEAQALKTFSRRCPSEAASLASTSSFSQPHI
jgi:hypothetical protein